MRPAPARAPTAPGHSARERGAAVVRALIIGAIVANRELFFANAFSFGARRRICQLAYRNTLDDLARRRDELRPMLAAHGIGLRDAVLDDPHRTVLTGLEKAPPRSTETTARLRRALDDTEHLLRSRR